MAAHARVRVLDCARSRDERLVFEAKVSCVFFLYRRVIVNEFCGVIVVTVVNRFTPYGHCCNWKSVRRNAIAEITTPQI